MKSSELRIGNLINVNGEIQEVCDIPLPENCTDKNTKPIPLTEEWLLKFGFERSGLYNVKSQVYIYDEHGLVDTGYEYRFNYTEMKLKYVHQLQNLYFALTGEELTISESQD